MWLRGHPVSYVFNYVTKLCFCLFFLLPLLLCSFIHFLYHSLFLFLFLSVCLLLLGCHRLQLHLDNSPSQYLVWIVNASTLASCAPLLWIMNIHSKNIWCCLHALKVNTSIAYYTVSSLQKRHVLWISIIQNESLEYISYTGLIILKKSSQSLKWRQII